MLGDIVEVESGRIRGILDQNGLGLEFRGIPFAAPPTGDLRWRPPVEVDPWPGIRNGDRFGSACIQPMNPRNGLMQIFESGDRPECGMSEDCLYLNIWTSAERAQERLPVLVWIHGGGNRVGAGSRPCSWGHNLSKRGIVVVTLNYRLGPLGFLAHPELTREQGHSGNYAGQDLVAALQWVRQNIAAFGGDPGRVTIMGQSAGAGHVQSLMASPLARGLFHRAVGFSGGRFDAEVYGYANETREQAEAKGLRVLEKAGVHDLTEMRNYPIDQLWGPRNFWNVIIDGKFVTEKIENSFLNGRQARVPFFAGYTADEATPFPNPSQWSVDGLVKEIREHFGAEADRLLTAYPVASDADSKRASYQMRTEGGFAWQAWRWAETHAATGVPTWVTRFEQALPLPEDMRFVQPKPDGGYGAFHGADLFYYFDTMDTKPDWPWRKSDRSVANAAADILTAFVSTGDPSTPECPSLPMFDGAASDVLHLADPIYRAPANEAERLDGFTAIFRRLNEQAAAGAALR